MPGELRGYLMVVPETRWVKNPVHLKAFLEDTTEHYDEHAGDLAAILVAPPPPPLSLSLSLFFFFLHGGLRHRQAEPRRAVGVQRTRPRLNVQGVLPAGRGPPDPPAEDRRSAGVRRWAGDRSWSPRTRRRCASSCRTVLVRLGYRVLVAADGLEAVEVATREQLDLLLTDVVMPGLSGPETATKSASSTPRADPVHVGLHRRRHPSPQPARAGRPHCSRSRSRRASWRRRCAWPSSVRRPARSSLLLRSRRTSSPTRCARDPNSGPSSGLATARRRSRLRHPTRSRCPGSTDNRKRLARGRVDVCVDAPRCLRVCASNDMIRACWTTPPVSTDFDRQRYAAIGRALADPKRLCVLESLAMASSPWAICDRSAARSPT